MVLVVASVINPSTGIFVTSDGFSPIPPFDNEQDIHMSSKNKLRGKQLQTQCETDNHLILHYTKHDIQCHLLFEITQCYTFLLPTDVKFSSSTYAKVL